MPIDGVGTEWGFRTVCPPVPCSISFLDSHLDWRSAFCIMVFVCFFPFEWPWSFITLLDKLQKPQAQGETRA